MWGKSTVIDFGNKGQTVLQTYSINPVSDKQALIKWVVFNCFIGNADARGKIYDLSGLVEAVFAWRPFMI